MTQAPSVAVVGHVTHDRYGELRVPGGCAYYAAHVYHWLGANVRLITQVGDDFACDHAIEVPAVIGRHGLTTEFTNSYSANGVRTQRVSAQASAVASYDRTARCDVLHLAPTMGEVDLAAWLDLAALDALVAIGIQGWIKAATSSGAVAQRPWQVASQLLKRVDVAFASDEDLRGQGDLWQRLVDAVPIVVVTHGQAGCDVHERDRITGVGVFRTIEVDPTGAGDVFAAAFVHALSVGAPTTDAARLGAAAASIIVEGRGGETLSRIDEAPLRALGIPAPEVIAKGSAAPPSP